MGSGGRAAWGSVAAGVASVAVLPLAIYLTRFSDSYDLLHAAFAIPGAAGFGVIAILLARAERRRSSVSLAMSGGRVVLVGRILGVIGLCLAASALVALGVYGLLEYVGSRD